MTIDFARTADSCFAELPNFPFTPKYQQIDDGEGGELRMHYVDEGSGEIIFCLHGQPTWSYVYRKMIPPLVAAGYRVIAPDLIGFGRSDKPTDRANYTYANHVAWVKSFMERLGLMQLTLFGQDWGGLIGLRLVAENAHRFVRVVAANTGLPDANNTPDEMTATLKQLLADTPALPPLEMGAKLAGPTEDRPPFMYWVRHCDSYPEFNPGLLVQASLKNCTEAEAVCYSAPFPAEQYKAGARQFPTLVPMIPDNPAIPANRAAWKFFANFNKPFLTAFSDMDPVTKGGERRFIDSVPGAKGQKHIIIKGAGHFLQDDAGEELALAVVGFMQNNPL